jgi:hypothetical protein
MNKDKTHRPAQYRRAAGKQFVLFASIESDPNASSVTWLQTRLADMAQTLRAGGSLTVYEPAVKKAIHITTTDELSAWANRHFPVARYER